MLGTEMVDLYVGPDKEHFRVHKAVLCSEIPYFDKMFNGGFSEASSNTATFPEDHGKAFDLLLGWVYGGDLIVTEEETRGDNPIMGSLIELSKLAHKLCLPPLEDRVVDMVRNIYRSRYAWPKSSRFLMVYSTLRESCGMRKYFAHCFAYLTLETNEHWPISGDEGLADAMIKSVDLTQDVLTILRASGGKVSSPNEVPDCNFHYHAEGEPCYKDK